MEHMNKIGVDRMNNSDYLQHNAIYIYIYIYIYI